MSVLQAARGQGQRFSEDLLHVREFCVQSNTSQVHQRAKKVVSDSPGLVDFAFGLVNSVLIFWGNSNYRRVVINPAVKKGFWAS